MSLSKTHCPNMTEKLLMWLLDLNTNKQIKLSLTCDSAIPIGLANKNRTVSILMRKGMGHTTVSAI